MSQQSLPKLRRISQVVFLALFLGLLFRTEFRGSFRIAQGEVRLPYPVSIFLQADPLAACIPGIAAKDPARAHELASQIRSWRTRAEALLTIAAALPETKPEGGP